MPAVVMADPRADPPAPEATARVSEAVPLTDGVMRTTSEIGGDEVV